MLRRPHEYGGKYLQAWGVAQFRSKAVAYFETGEPNLSVRELKDRTYAIRIYIEHYVL